jgi:serine/threonine-protein kinase HipA
MMADVSVLEVLLYGEVIGALTRLADDRVLFAFNEAYAADAGRPVLSLGFKDDLGGLLEFGATRTRVLPFFSNLLPEGPLRTYLAQRAGVNLKREFFLLWVLGADLPGAVTVRPADGETWPTDTDHDGDDDHHHRPNALRFSLAGVQLKFSAVQEVRGGLTIPAKGVGGSWIVKLPSNTYEGVPENEFSMLNLARLCGINAPAVQLIDTESIGNLPEGLGALKGPALAVERFDRLSDGGSVHIEDFAQVFRVYPEDKYEQGSARSIARVIAAECGLDDAVEFIRRLVFNALIGNADMHLKNWSLIYPDRRHAALAPAYDFVATIAYLPDEEAALKFSRSRRFADFDEDELRHLAAKALLPEKLVLDTARETVKLFHKHWQAAKGNLPLSSDVVRAVEAHLKTVPIA